jgi:serine O-acetyltransferase
MEETITSQVARLLASYEEVGGLNHTDRHNLPSKRALDTICSGLLRLLFPGFHDERPVHKEELPDITRERLVVLASQLADQVAKSLSNDHNPAPEAAVARIVDLFFDEIPSIRRLLRSDIEAAYDGDPSATSTEEIILSYPAIEAIAIQRCAHRLYLNNVPILPRMMTEWAHTRTGIDIHPGARLGTHFFIDHGTGVVIGETCRLGDHVKLYHGVTLGARSFARDELGKIVKGGKRHPNVGDHVTIYPNSTILGGETTIGSGSTIGANVFLMQSVPEKSLVIYEEKQLRVLPKERNSPPAS